MAGNKNSTDGRDRSHLQTSLFPVEKNVPSGFRYIETFLSIQEEQALLENISLIDLHPLIFQGYEAKRKVKSFGYDYHFDSRTLTEGRPIPEGFTAILERVAGQINLPASDIKEVLITEYPPGAVINWHRDAPPFDIIIGISLMSDCKFRFRPYDKSQQGRGSIIALPVKRRSLYVLSGEARSDWEHSIAPVKAQRYSLTLRTLKR
ncbi:alpha-ketoglutarate-dependent dioxygenase AlkB [Parapedobacter deserti]|uniref:Alpha-ketoglutarate-dependent dioxygenase AlkB n=1 Tax=Parapedobacter deserti TaxID=1912957 RepID=A0ABV7JPP2_9SPHI